MKPQVNIMAVVDVIGALSARTLLDGNLCMVDNGDYRSTGQGTPALCTLVCPGQAVQWTALAVDLQTPVDIKSIRFLDPLGGEGVAWQPQHAAPIAANGGFPHANGSDASLSNGEAGAGSAGDSDTLDLDVWIGLVPPWMTPGVPYKYRLELQMYEGDNSIMHVDLPALMSV
ncbi:hypothetical protein [Yinghuangia soli]|uniref:Inclusion body protein n=1 Tax=Yinghuangia soli TaxID=2908204 RepID=A0AA41Q3V2_9ACTN|nr:hypothetical protein [Yinghuangia soli]MCF2530226.1 hypothetical protein [Yinghuangia soli]